MPGPPVPVQIAYDLVGIEAANAPSEHLIYFDEKFRSAYRHLTPFGDSIRGMLATQGRFILRLVLTGFPVSGGADVVTREGPRRSCSPAG